MRKKLLALLMAVLMIVGLATTAFAGNGNNGNNGNNANSGNGNGNGNSAATEVSQQIFLKGSGSSFTDDGWQNIFYVGGAEDMAEYQAWHLVYSGKNFNAITEAQVKFTNGEVFEWTPAMGPSVNNGGNNMGWVIVAPLGWAIDYVDKGNNNNSDSYLKTTENGNVNFNISGYNKYEYPTVQIAKTWLDADGAEVETGTIGPNGEIALFDVYDADGNLVKENWDGNAFKVAPGTYKVVEQAIDGYDAQDPQFITVKYNQAGKVAFVNVPPVIIKQFAKIEKIWDDGNPDDLIALFDIYSYDYEEDATIDPIYEGVEAGTTYAVDPGWYYVEEQAIEGYIEQNPVILFIGTGDTVTFSFKNEPNPPTYLSSDKSFTKLTLIDGDYYMADDGVFNFAVYKDGNNEALFTKTSIDGIITITAGNTGFEEIDEPGNYVIKEVNIPDSWTQVNHLDGLTLTVDSEFKMVWTVELGDVEDEFGSTDPIILNAPTPPPPPTGTVILEKKIVGGAGEIIAWAELANANDITLEDLLNLMTFKLYATDQNGGTPIGDAITTGRLQADGNIIFDYYESLPNGWYMVAEEFQGLAHDIFTGVATLYFEFRQGMVRTETNSLDPNVEWKIRVGNTGAGRYQLNYTKKNADGKGLTDGGNVFYIGINDAPTRNSDNYTVQHDSFCAWPFSTTFAGSPTYNCTGHYIIADPDDLNIPPQLRENVDKMISALNFIRDEYGDLAGGSPYTSATNPGTHVKPGDNRIIAQVVLWVLLGHIDVNSDEFEATNLTADEKAHVRAALQAAEDGYIPDPGDGEKTIIVDMVLMVCSDHPYFYDNCQPQLVPIYGNVHGEITNVLKTNPAE